MHTWRRRKKSLWRRGDSAMNLGFIASAFALGATLGLLPGPVQFVLLTEASRGGMRRGFAAMAGANGTFGILLLVFAAGIATLAPNLTMLRILRVGGGLFLLFLAVDATRAALRPVADEAQATGGVPPLWRGILAVVLNPGAWIFVITTAASLFAGAARSGGRGFALLTSIAMVAGIAGVDGPMVLLGGGVRRFEERLARWLTPVLATGLAGFGVLLVAQGIHA